MEANKIELFTQFANELGADEFFDPAFRDGEWMLDAVETRETLADFEEAASGYAEHTPAKRCTRGGFEVLAFRSVQIRKGQPRRALSVIDFGEFRVAIDADLESFS